MAAPACSHVLPASFAAMLVVQRHMLIDHGTNRERWIGRDRGIAGRVDGEGVSFLTFTGMTM